MLDVDIDERWREGSVDEGREKWLARLERRLLGLERVV